MERQIIRYENKTFLLEMGNKFNRFNYMLKRRDRETAPLVMEYLHQNEMDVYLGGGVIMSWIFNGNRKYSDVDILGVAKNEQKRLDLVRKLIALPGSLKIKNKNFGIEEGNSITERIYMSGLVNERFKFYPKKGLFVKPSVIDVSLVSLNQFHNNIFK